MNSKPYDKAYLHSRDSRAISEKGVELNSASKTIPRQTTIFPALCLRVNQRRNMPTNRNSRQSDNG
ncbi:MAG: hypothetical protein JRC53_06280 [Deltaproteobacteria bacterium]|nr:hypothetical protein [Deltaproteobacteria bacterium]